jgi:hypothetical protein
MSGPTWRLPLCWILILIILGGASAQAQTAAPVSWLQLEPGCKATPEEIRPGDREEPQIVACGGAGSFIVGRPGLDYNGPCQAIGATEAPALIPVEPAPRVPEAFACSQGSCLGRSTDRPWVALLDWPTAHGWSVAATVQEASDQRVDVELYDLTAAGALAEWVPPVSDLHVLVQLCALAETAQAHPGDRPLAVNMSFGRRQTGAACLQSGPSLGCSVSQVLSHLATVEGLPLVAAAGNHHELLFPASSSGVISAGALDLSHFQRTQETRPSTQTPSESEALMLGYGIYLPVEGGDQDWPVPPGSSYAAALLTGWLGGALAGGDQMPGPLLTEGARWTPVLTGKGLALARDGVPLPGSELTGPRLLLDRAMGAALTSRKLWFDATLRLTGPAPLLPELPLLYADGGSVPQPGVDPCVPCRGIGDPGGMPEAPDTVLVDLSYSGALPPQMELLGVWLRVGKAVYAFEESRDPGLLAAVAAGTLEGLALTEVGGIFPAGEQLSLVLVVHVNGSSYWHEVPLHLQG